MFAMLLRHPDSLQQIAWAVLAILGLASVRAALCPWGFGRRRRDVAAFLPLVFAAVCHRLTIRELGGGQYEPGLGRLWAGVRPDGSAAHLDWLLGVAVPFAALACAFSLARRPVELPFWWERAVAAVSRRLRGPDRRAAWILDPAAWEDSGAAR